MKYILIILLLLFTSCSPLKWIKERENKFCELLDCCPVDSTKSRIETNKDTTYEPYFISYADTSMFDILMNDSITISKESGKDSISVKQDENMISVRKYTRDSLEIMREILRQTTIKTDTIYHTRTKRVPVKKPYVPWYIYLLWGFSLAGLFYLGTKF